MTDTPEAVRLADQIHAGNGEWMQKAAALLRRIPGLEAEVQEQARLNGMGAERELALMAQVSRIEAERDGLNAARFAYASEFGLDDEGQPDVGSIHQNIRELKAELDQLRAELEKVRCLDVDDLAQFIRQIEGRHNMGAGALAELIVEWFYAAPTPPNADQKGQ